MPTRDVHRSTGQGHVGARAGPVRLGTGPRDDRALTHHDDRGMRVAPAFEAHRDGIDLPQGRLEGRLQ